MEWSESQHEQCSPYLPVQPPPTPISDASNLCLVNEHPDVLRPGIIGARGSMVTRLRLGMTRVPPATSLETYCPTYPNISDHADSARFIASSGSPNLSSESLAASSRRKGPAPVRREGCNWPRSLLGRRCTSDDVFGAFPINPPPVTPAWRSELELTLTLFTLYRSCRNHTPTHPAVVFGCPTDPRVGVGGKRRRKKWRIRGRRVWYGHEESRGVIGVRRTCLCGEGGTGWYGNILFFTRHILKTPPQFLTL